MNTFRNSVRAGLVLVVCVVSFAALGLNSSTMASGVWGLATRAEFADGVQASRSNAYFGSVSCASAGDCTAVGRFRNVGGGYEAFTMTSTDGVWGQATPAVFADGVQGESQDDRFESVSCASAGDCTAVGKFRVESGSFQAFTMTSTNGVWGQATPAVFADGVANTDAPSDSFFSVSCASAGHCTAVGSFRHVNGNFQAFTMTSTDGVWGQATPAVFADGVQGEYKETFFYSVSCGSVGNCSAVGYFANVNENYEAFTMTSTNGVWGQATPLVFADGVQSESPDSQSFSVSCGSVGNCTAVGYFKNVDRNYEAFTMMSTYTPPAETTTTVAATTTTVAATTTTVAATTTTAAAILLPATGSDSNGWLMTAMCAVITGTVLITRRRRIN